MLGEEIFDSGALSAMRQLIQRRIALADGDDLVFGNLGQHFAEAPDAAHVGSFE